MLQSFHMHVCVYVRIVFDFVEIVFPQTLILLDHNRLTRFHEPGHEPRCFEVMLQAIRWLEGIPIIFAKVLEPCKKGSGCLSPLEKKTVIKYGFYLVFDFIPNPLIGY